MPHSSPPSKLPLTSSSTARTVGIPPALPARLQRRYQVPSIPGKFCSSAAHHVKPEAGELTTPEHLPHRHLDAVRTVLHAPRSRWMSSGELPHPADSEQFQLVFLAPRAQLVCIVLQRKSSFPRFFLVMSARSTRSTPHPVESSSSSRGAERAKGGLQVIDTHPSV